MRSSSSEILRESASSVDEVLELGDLAGERELGGIGQQRVVAVLADGLDGHGVHAHLSGLLRRDAGGLAQDGADAGVRVLDVVHGVVLALLLDGLDLELDGLVGRAGDQGVTSGVGTDLVNELLEGDHGALALGHANRLAVAEQIHELAEQDLELAGVTQGVANARPRQRAP